MRLAKLRADRSHHSGFVGPRYRGGNHRTTGQHRKAEGRLLVLADPPTRPWARIQVCRGML